MLVAIVKCVVLAVLAKFVVLAVFNEVCRAGSRDRLVVVKYVEGEMKSKV